MEYKRIDGDHHESTAEVAIRPSAPSSSACTSQQQAVTQQPVSHQRLVLTTQPTPRQSPPPPPPRRWSSGIFACLEDMESCLCGLACTPCYACCELSPRMGESHCAPLCLGLLGRQSVALLYRTKLRTAYGIEGNAIEDCLLAWLFPACVLCQIKRELDFIERSTARPAFDV